ncbi:MAG: type II toxin-antitoxin system VapC family toxin [Halobacteriales archaeon]|nr:type II toxin-antitoxin system VapC family toxin [Halobacteriales archaeon]
MIALDSNVWIYAFDAGLDEHAGVAPAVEDLLSSETPVFVNSVIRLEVVHYLVKNLRTDGGSAGPDSFLNLDGVVTKAVTSEDVKRAAEILSEHDETGLGGRDASLVASMEGAGVSVLWTHDTGLKRLGDRLGWLDVRDPVNE